MRLPIYPASSHLPLTLPLLPQIRYLDRVSELLVRSCHAVPYFDYIINARYDLFYWPDPACPLEATADGIVVRKALTPDGYCAIRPCEAQASLPGTPAHH